MLFRLIATGIGRCRSRIVVGATVRAEGRVKTVGQARPRIGDGHDALGGRHGTVILMRDGQHSTIGIVVRTGGMIPAGDEHVVAVVPARQEDHHEGLVGGKGFSSCHRGIHETQMGQGIDDRGSAHRGTRRLGHGGPANVARGGGLGGAEGRVSSSRVAGIRRRINGTPNRSRRDSRRKRARPYRRGGFSRWSRLEPVDPEPETAESKAHQLLLRYGVVFPELLAREPMAPSWRELVRTYRRLEARGEIRGGRFVAGFVGEQFAMPEAVESLRAVNKDQSRGHMEVVSACDPLNLVGILTPGERVPAILGNKAVFRDGVPVASLENGKVVDRSGADQAVLADRKSVV